MRLWNPLGVRLSLTGKKQLMKKSSPSPRWGHRLPATALALSARGLDKKVKRCGCDKICRVGQSDYQGEGSLGSCEGPGCSSAEPISFCLIIFSLIIYI